MKWILLLLAVLILVIGLVAFQQGELLWTLLTGWVQFLIYVLPRMTFEGPSLALGALAVLLFLLGVHIAARRWYRPSPTQAPALPSRWRWRWSAALILILFVAFAAGLAMVGLTHQFIWLATSDEPMKVQTLSSRWSSDSNLRMIGLGLQNYQSAYGRRFPAGGTFAPDGSMRHSWVISWIPWTGWTISSEYDVQLPWNHPHNQHVTRRLVPELINADFRNQQLYDADGFGLSHYATNPHVMGPNRGLRVQDITDGASNTFLLGEVNANFKPWAHPVSWREPALGVGRSPHGFGGPPKAGGALLLMADGSVRFVSDKAKPQQIIALSTPASGERLDDD